MRDTSPGPSIGGGSSNKRNNRNRGNEHYDG